MVGITFDMAKAVRTLRGRGHTAEQAEGVVEAIVDSQEGLATKADVRELQLAMKAGLDALRSELAVAMAQMEARFTRLLWLQLGAYTAATAAFLAAGLAIAAVLWG